MNLSFNGISEVTRKRIVKWLMQAKPIEVNPTWTERRQAIVIGGHTYIVAHGQVFQCAHCGHFDPEWNATEVLAYAKEMFNAEPFDIEVTCTVKADDDA